MTHLFNVYPALGGSRQLHQSDLVHLVLLDVLTNLKDCFISQSIELLELLLVGVDPPDSASLKSANLTPLDLILGPDPPNVIHASDAFLSLALTRFVLIV